MLEVLFRESVKGRIWPVARREETCYRVRRLGEGSGGSIRAGDARSQRGEISPMDFITLLDGIVIVVMLVSALLAMYRGFLREVLSIGSWVAAAAAAYLLHKQALPYVKPYISSEQVALGVSAAVIFVVTLLVVSYITMKISDFVLDSAFGALDRSAGFLFGAARGLLLIVVAMQFFNWFVEADKQPTWVAKAKSKPVIDFLGQRLVAALPEDAEKTILNKFGKRREDTAPADTQQPDESKLAPQKRTELAPGNPGYKPSEKRGLDQLITGSAKTQ